MDEIETQINARHSMSQERKKELEDYIYSRYQECKALAERFNELADHALEQYERLIGE